MLISNPNLARYSDAYGRQLFLNTAMFGDSGQLRALSHNLNRFGTVENPSPFAGHLGIYADGHKVGNVAPPAKFSKELPKRLRDKKSMAAAGLIAP